MTRKLSSAGVLALVLAFASFAYAEAKPANPGVVPPQANFRGLSYGEWHVLWWQWADSFTNDKSPVYQKGGAVDTSNQSGDVWFLAGYFGDWFTPQGPVKFTRRIAIPTGTALFFPILNGELTPNEYKKYVADFLSDPDNDPHDLLSQWEFLESWMDPAYVDLMEAKIDGKLVKNLGAYRAPCPEPYETWLPVENHMSDYYPNGGDAYPVYCDGWCLLVEPLSVGKHTISFKATFGPNLGMDITYEITVVPGKKK